MTACYSYQCWQQLSTVATIVKTGNSYQSWQQLSKLATACEGFVIVIMRICQYCLMYILPFAKLLKFDQDFFIYYHCDVRTPHWGVVWNELGIQIKIFHLFLLYRNSITSTYIKLSYFSTFASSRQENVAFRDVHCRALAPLQQNCPLAFKTARKVPEISKLFKTPARFINVAAYPKVSCFHSLFHNSYEISLIY